MSAWISAVAREDIVRRMSRSLRPLPSRAFLACLTAREACYVRAGIAPDDVAALDAAALRVEQLRRAVYAALERDEALAVLREAA